MKEIKTIIMPATNPAAFDEAVNTAIAAGWELKYREALPAGQSSAEYCRALYAELERDRRSAKRCATCKHHESDGMDSPCNSCDTSYNKWEAAT